MLSKALKRLRARAGLNQLELAQKARVDQGYLSMLERGKKRNPGALILARIAKALGVTIDEMLR